MAQGKVDDITASDLLEYVETQDDFAFELEVYRIADELGLSPKHAWTYADPQTNKMRQFDIQARASIGNKRIQLAVECKSLKPSYPLLVLRVPRPVSDSFHDLIYSDGVPSELHQYQYARHRRTPGGYSLYPPGDLVGKSMRQVKRVNEHLMAGDDVFDKWMQAAASAGDLITEAIEYHKPNRSDHPMTFVVPLLAVSDGALWAADFDEAGNLDREPKQVEEVTFFIGRDYSYPKVNITYTISHLHICTKTRVRGFLRQMTFEDNPFWLTAFPVHPG